MAAKKSLLDRLSPARFAAKVRETMAGEARVRAAALEDAVARLRAAYPDRGERLALELEQYSWHAWYARKRSLCEGVDSPKPLFGHGCSACPRSADGEPWAAVFSTYMGYVDHPEGLKDPEYVDTSVRRCDPDAWRENENEWAVRVCATCVATAATLTEAGRGTYDLHSADSRARTGPDPALMDALRADLDRALAGSPSLEAVRSWIAPVPDPDPRAWCSNHHQGDSRPVVRLGPDLFLCARCVRDGARVGEPAVD